MCFFFLFLTVFFYDIHFFFYLIIQTNRRSFRLNCCTYIAKDLFIRFTINTCFRYAVAQSKLIIIKFYLSFLTKRVFSSFLTKKKKKRKSHYRTSHHHCPRNVIPKKYNRVAFHKTQKPKKEIEIEIEIPSFRSAHIL